MPYLTGTIETQYALWTESVWDPDSGQVTGIRGDLRIFNRSDRYWLPKNWTTGIPTPSHSETPPTAG